MLNPLNDLNTTHFGAGFTKKDTQMLLKKAFCPMCGHYSNTFKVPAFPTEALRETTFCTNCCSIISKPRFFNHMISNFFEVEYHYKDGTISKEPLERERPIQLFHQCADGFKSQLTLYNEFIYSKKETTMIIGLQYECPRCRCEAFAKYRKY